VLRGRHTRQHQPNQIYVQLSILTVSVHTARVFSAHREEGSVSQRVGLPAPATKAAGVTRLRVRALQTIAVAVEDVRSAVVVLGVIVALAGLLFALQGFGAVSGSTMSNTTTWSILGPIIALIGIAIAFVAWRGPRS
jgi:hypothetical protein